MDPTANLEEQRRLSASILKSYDLDSTVDVVDAARLSELVQALDEWMSLRGSIPNQWAV